MDPAEVDILFVLDATQSTQPIFNSMIDYVNEMASNIEANFKQASVKYGAVIYRDPVTYKDPKGLEVDVELQNQINEMEKKEREKKLRENGIDPEEVEAKIKERKRHYNREHFPFNKNVCIQMDSEMNNFVVKLMEVECGSGNDNPEDWAGAMELAVNEIDWRPDSKKQIIWISDDNAHGEYFCGKKGHEEEVERLLQLTRRVAEMGIYFSGINVVRKSDRGCQRTLEKLKKKYDECGGRSFIIEEFSFSKDNYTDDQYWPQNVMEGFMEAISRTIFRRGGALTDTLI